MNFSQSQTLTTQEFANQIKKFAGVEKLTISNVKASKGGNHYVLVKLSDGQEGIFYVNKEEYPAGTAPTAIAWKKVIETDAEGKQTASWFGTKPDKNEGMEF